MINCKTIIPNRIKQDLEKKKILKLITGLNNFNLNKIYNICIAASRNGVTYIDISSDPYLIKAIKKITDLPICASSILPEELYQSVEAGVDIIELGNYESFYEKGLIVNADHIIYLTNKIRSKMPNIPLTVTIPSYLELNEQIKLAIKLQDYNIDFLQTEGKYKIKSQYLSDYIKLALPTLISTEKISKLVNIPIICSSGISMFTAPLATYFGASGIGVGSLLNNIRNKSDLDNLINNLKLSLLVVLRNKNKVLNK
ncbi:hypothetical protein GpartN1_CHLp125 (chloroplast) [Galdieria partita]|uniref:Uncharacterized protein ycf23 n=1 Tax=Galdieria partita TaxID=83374 RepID=A0A9C7F491_9RHOD|nr:hypothetical protein GpartN1_CHLp125 [Galdieria partita]